MQKYFIPDEQNDYKPHLMREKSLALIALLLVAVFGVFTLAQYTIQNNPNNFAAIITGVLVDLTNSSRLSGDLAPLSRSPVLDAAAQDKANHMAENGYFAHNSPDGITPWHWFRTVGYDFAYAGENLAVNFSDSENVVQAWMNSEGHRANILNDKFTEIGIAIAHGTYKGQSTIYVVQMFGRPALQTVAQPSASETTPDITSEVGGAQATNEALDIIAKEDSFIAVKNTEAVPAEENYLQQAAQASVTDKAFASPQHTLKTLYSIIGVIVAIGLILFVFVKPKKQYPKNILLALFVLALLFFLLYIANNLITQSVEVAVVI